MKPRAAVIVPGGVGSGRHIPSLVQVLFRLTTSHEIHLYSFSSADRHPLLDLPNLEYTVPPKWMQPHKFLSLLFIVLKIVKDHHARSFSLVHCFWIFPSGVAALAASVFVRRPIVLTLPGGDTVRIPVIRYGGMKSPVHRALIRLCCSRADHTVMLTTYQEGIARANNLRFTNVRIIPFGVDMPQFTFRPRDLATPLRLLSIGSMNTVKDIFLQIETFAVLRREIECRFTIVGEDILEGRARAFAASLHVADLIQWKGYCAHDEIPSLLYDAHLLVHTAWYEAEGVVLMEAFAAGTVVVGTRVGLLAETDTGGEYTIEAHDPALLAETILALIRKPERYRSLQNKNRLFAERHTIDWTAAAYQSLYQAQCLLSSPNAGGQV
jgi:glycosyltransferase involved in cell wall biosynthesis